jgi:hypothetical protein
VLRKARSVVEGAETLVVRGIIGILDTVLREAWLLVVEDTERAVLVVGARFRRFGCELRCTTTGPDLGEDKDRAHDGDTMALDSCAGFFDDWMIGDWSIGGIGYTLGLARHYSMIFCYVHDCMHHSPTHLILVDLYSSCAQAYARSQW